jgi:hypothetical protein
MSIFGTGKRNRVVFISLAACASLVYLNTKTSFSSILGNSLISSDGFNPPIVHHGINETAPANHLGASIHVTSVIPLAQESTNGGTNLSVSFVTAEGVVQEGESKTTETEEVKSEKVNEETKAANGKPLNILILYPDDLRHDSIGCAGTQPVMTPFLDSLAQEGIRFTYNAVTTSICWIRYGLYEVE